MPHLARLLRSVIRIVVAVAVIASAGLAGLGAALRQLQEWPNRLFALLYPSTGDFIGVAGGWSDRELARTVKRAIAESGGIRVVSFSGPRETSDASDHRNYWAQGWSAVMVTDTAFLRNPNYHTVRDTADTLDYARMARVVDGLLHAIVTIAG